MRQHQDEMLRYCREIKASRKINEIIADVVVGGGKSLLPMIAAHELIPAIAKRIIWVVPREALALQAEEDWIRPEIQQIIGHRTKIRKNDNTPDPSRGHIGYVTTWQAIMANPKIHLDALSDFPTILVLDEPHHYEDGKSITTLILEMRKRAVLNIQQSGTFYRPDTQIGTINYRRVEGGSVPDLPEQSTVIGNTAYIIYRRADALAEHTILPLRFVQCDGDVTFELQQQMAFLSSLAGAPKDLVRPGIRAALDVDYAKQVIERMLIEWSGYRSVFPWSKCIIVADTQAHARDYLNHIRNIIKSNNITARPCIAISEDNDQAKDAIARYKKPNTKPDAFDCMVAIGKVYEGFSVKDLTHLAYLTDIRTDGYGEQTFGRVNRISENAAYEVQRGYVYHLDDLLMQEIIKRIYAEQRSVLPDPIGPDGSIEIYSPEEPRKPSTFAALDGSLGAVQIFDMETGQEVGYQETAYYDAIIRNANLTGRVDALEVQRLLAAQQTTRPEPLQVPTAPNITPSQMEKALRDSIEAVSHRIANRYFDGNYELFNGKCKKQFRKSRTVMNEDELRKVQRWMSTEYPL
jgi:hypothetical protein